MDLFDGLDGLGGSTSQKKMSLAEQLEAKKSAQRNAFDGVDLLAAPKSSGSTPVPSASTPSQADDDLFGLFTSAPPPKPSQPVSKPASQSRPVSKTDWQPIVVPKEPLNERLFEPEEPVQPKQPPRPPQQPNPPIGDRKLLKMEEMGFESADAKRALNAMNGDVRGAVNYLMAEAQGLPLPQPRKQADFSDLQTAASQIGASMFSKASSLFAKGKREIEKAYNQYQGPPVDGQPAWMREKPKYDARRARLEQEGVPTNTESSTRSSNREPIEPIEPVRKAPEHGVKPKSRAELFRQKQQARKQPGQTQPAPAVDLLSTSEPKLTETPKSEPPPPVETPVETPDIDLLNLSSSTPATTTLSSTESDLYITAKDMGTGSFRRGNYEEAIEHYSTALQIVSAPTPQRALLLSNRSAAYIKAGNLRGAFDDTSEGINLIPNRGVNHPDVDGANMHEIWVKLVTRNAQSAESMEKHQEALKSYQLLLDNGHASPTILDAKRRCLKALNPEQVQKAQTAKTAAMPNRRGWGTTGAVPTSAAGKAALEKVKNSHEQQRAEEQQRDLLRDKVNQRIDRWKQGKEDNLRALLSSLQDVLWDSCNWQPVPASELVVSKKVRVVYMKAVARTHPDKVPSSASVEVKMIAQAVFMVIQSAWEAFKS